MIASCDIVTVPQPQGPLREMEMEGEEGGAVVAEFLQQFLLDAGGVHQRAIVLHCAPHARHQTAADTDTARHTLRQTLRQTLRFACSLRGLQAPNSHVRMRHVTTEQYQSVAVG